MRTITQQMQNKNKHIAYKFKKKKNNREFPELKSIIEMKNSLGKLNSRFYDLTDWVLKKVKGKRSLIQ